MPLAELPLANVTPSESGLPVPSRYRSALPALQPSAGSGVQIVPLKIRRKRVPGPFRAAHSTAGEPPLAPWYVSPLRFVLNTLVPSTVVTSSLPGHGCRLGAITQEFAAPLVEALVTMKLPVPLGQRPKSWRRGFANCTNRFARRTA